MECAFGRLKARFGILRKPIDLSLRNIPATILTCFVLHNFCEVHNEHIGNDLAASIRRYDNEFQQPPAQQQSPDMHNNERGGKNIRQIFVKYFE